MKAEACPGVAWVAMAPENIVAPKIYVKGWQKGLI